MSTDSRYSKRQEQALIHWYQNLITVMTMDWDEWVKKSLQKRHDLIHEPLANVPHITAEYCVYCQECDCATCPLKGPEADCCTEWEDVLSTVVCLPDRDKAIAAIEVMIQHIQEVHDGNNTL